MSVSIIMPYYKKREFVGIAIESALSQTYQDFEIIIIYDDENLDDDEKHIRDLKLSPEDLELLNKSPAFGCRSETESSVRYVSSKGPKQYDL